MISSLPLLLLCSHLALPAAYTLPADTAIKVTVLAPVVATKAKVGQKVLFAVQDDVLSQDHAEILIRQGDVVGAEVVESTEFKPGQSASRLVLRFAVIRTAKGTLIKIKPQNPGEKLLSVNGDGNLVVKKNLNAPSPSVEEFVSALNPDFVKSIRAASQVAGDGTTDQVFQKLLTDKNVQDVYVALRKLFTNGDVSGVLDPATAARIKPFLDDLRQAGSIGNFISTLTIARAFAVVNAALAINDIFKSFREWIKSRRTVMNTGASLQVLTTSDEMLESLGQPPPPPGFNSLDWKISPPITAAQRVKVVNSTLAVLKKRHVH